MFRKHGYLILVTALFAIGAFLRLYNFENRIIFGPEQGMSLITSASNLEKFSLLGETNLIRSTSSGHMLFHGVFYSYLILPIQILFNFKVLPLTLFFTFLNLLTAFILFKIVQNLFGKMTAALTLFFFLFSDVMIHHSLFVWIVNPTPLLAVISLWLISKLTKNRNNLNPVLWIGFLSGLGFGMQNFYLLLAVFLFFVCLIVSKRHVTSALVFLFGVLLGSLPTIVFDIRHDFYHVRTYWQFFLELFSGKASGSSTYYNFLFLYPYLFLFYAIISKILFRTWKPLLVIPLAIWIYSCFASPFVNFQHSTGMYPGITLKSLESAASLIARDNPPERFNVATLWDFDTRAHPLRYILNFYYQKKPQAYEVYKDIDALYVFAPNNYDMKDPKVWELEVFYPYKIINMQLDVPEFTLYKLVK